MAYEVVVVGGGIGGLTAAALLAARGVNVCLIEKESRAGGCITNFENFGYEFEPGAGLYSSWGPDEIHDRVFRELPVVKPEVRKVSPAYVVRLPDRNEVAISENARELEDALRTTFPECADAAINFYRELETHSASDPFRSNDAFSKHLAQMSPRFRRFIDVQLQFYSQCDSESCTYSQAAVALATPRHGAYAIRGGALTLADALVEAIRKSGGTVRLDTTVLRLAYGSGGHASGVDLLSGETVEASRAVISNLTVWDTYGKLVGLSRTPNDDRSRLKHLSGWGAYLLFLSLDEEAAARLPAEHILALTDWQAGQSFDPEQTQFMFAAAPDWDRRAPPGKRAVTVSTFTEASQWFAFHEDEAQLEEQDQAALETWWERLHAAIPELGGSVEVIETITPRDYYKNTRRKLGMIGNVGSSSGLFVPDHLTYKTHIPNLFMAGDTVYPGQGVAAVTHSGLIVADEIAPSPKR